VTDGENEGDDCGDWWGDMHRMRWARRRVNTMRLTEWRRDLIQWNSWNSETVHSFCIHYPNFIVNKNS